MQPLHVHEINLYINISMTTLGESLTFSSIYKKHLKF